MTDFVAPESMRRPQPGVEPPTSSGGFVAPESMRVPAGEGLWANAARDNTEPTLVPLENPTGTPIWMRGNPGITQFDESSPPSRDIPRATREQIANRVPSADIGDWARYLSGLSFVMDTLPGMLGHQDSQRKTNELMARIEASLGRQNAQPGVNELLLQPQYSADSANWWRDEGRSWQTAVNYFLTNDEERRAVAIRNIYPEAEFRRDERGYLQVRRDPSEPFAYLNKPGVSVTDFSDVASLLTRFLPAARAASIPATLGGRALVGGGASAGTELGSQALGQVFGGDDIDIGQVGEAGVFGLGGQLAADVAMGVAPAAYQAVRRSMGLPEAPRAPLPDPAPPGSPRAPAPPPPPAARPDAATRGTPDEIAALEDELAALRQRGPTGTIDPNDRHAVARSVIANERPIDPLPEYVNREMYAIELESRIPDVKRSSEATALRRQAAELRAANELDDIERQLNPATRGADTPAPSLERSTQLSARAAEIRQQFPNVETVRSTPVARPGFGADTPTLSADGGVQANLARQRHAEEIEALERRIAEARQPYFAEGPTHVPVTSVASDDAINAAFQMVRTQRVPSDAADALAARIEERLHNRVLANGEAGPATGTDISTIRNATDDYANTQNALAILDRLMAQSRIGTATYRQAQQVRNALRHFENTATTDLDKRAIERIMLAYDEWLDLAFSTQRAGVQGLDDILNASGLSLNQRTASLALRDAPVAPQTPITVRSPPPPRATPTPSRTQVRSAFDEQRIPGSRGQISQDVRARQREDDLIQSGDPRALRFADEQAAAIERRGTEIATRGNDPVSTNVEEAGDVLRRDIQEAFDTLDDLADTTYNRAFELLKEQRVQSGSADTLRSTITQRIERGTGARDDPMFQYDDSGLRQDVILGDPRNYPQSSAAIRQIERLADRIEEGNINFAVVARIRQAINALAKNADGIDIMAMRNIRHGFDEWFNSQLARGQTFRITSGELAERAAAEAALRQEAHTLYQEANSLWRMRQELFAQRTSGRDPGGAAIERIRDPRGEITGTQIINAIFNSKGTPTAAAVGALRRIRDASLRSLPDGRQAARGVETDAMRAFNDPNGVLTPAMQSLREAFWHRILSPIKDRRPGSLVPARATANNLERALNGDGNAITRLLHTPAEMEQMRRLLQVIKYVERPIGVNTSGTAITAARMLQGAADGLASSIPRTVAWIPRLVRVMFGRDLDDLARSVESKQRFTRPLIDVDYGSSQSGAAGGQVVLDQDNRSRRANRAPPTDEQQTSPERGPGYDPMEGVTDINSFSSGTVSFYDGQLWITLPTGDGQSGGVASTVRRWRDGEIRPIAESQSEDEARTAAQSYRASIPQPLMAPGRGFQVLQPTERRDSERPRSFDQPEARRSDNFEDAGMRSPLLERNLQDPRWVERYVDGREIATRVRRVGDFYRVEWYYPGEPEGSTWFNAGGSWDAEQANRFEEYVSGLFQQHGGTVQRYKAGTPEQARLQELIDAANATRR